MRAFWMASSAGLAIAVSTPVFAQDAKADGDDQGIGEIIVTAQRKAETLQDAAVAIDAVSGDSLVDAGITNARDITKLVPSLTIGNGGGVNASLFLRGVGNRTNSSYNDPAIAISYDGVYVARPAGVTGAAFYDLERVEVLKGPQGILYGRNATGGAINIIPAKPKLGDRAAGFSVTAGNYDTVNAEGYVNLPLGDTIAARFAATRQSQDGYNRDGTDDRDVWALRGQILFEPNDQWSVRIGADYTKLGGRGPGTHYVGNYALGPTGYVFTASPFDLSEGLGTAAANTYRRTLLSAPGFGFLTNLNTQTFLDMEYWGINAEIKADLGIGELTIIPAYRKDQGSVAFNGPSFNTAINVNRDSQFSLEARLAGDVGMIDYLVGGFYIKDKAFQNTNFNQEFVTPIQNYNHQTNSWAAFGQLTANVSDRFRVIGGLRYTHDKKEIDGIINNFITFCGGLPPANLTPASSPVNSFANGCAAPTSLPRYPNLLNPPAMVSWLVSGGWIAPSSVVQPNTQVFPLLNGRGTILKTHVPVIDTRTFSRVTWRASVEFDITEDNLLYATYETGYRAGGMQLAEGRSRYNPEYLDSFSIGSKNRFLDDRVQLNLEAFWWKYKDQQITYFTVDAGGVLINSNENAGRVEIKGLDADLIVKPTRTTTLSGKVQYLDAAYKSLHLFTASPRDNYGCPFTLTGRFAGGQPVKDFNCSGRQGVFAPKWTVNLGAEQIVPIGTSLDLVGSVNSAWRDSQEGGFEFLPFTRIPSYWTTDLNLTLRDADGGWSVSAYVLNLEDKRRSLYPQLAPTGQAITAASAPRTYGIRLSADF